MKTITTDCKRAVYTGPQDAREHALSFGMTGYYDTVHKTFIPDGKKCCYHAVPEDCFKITQY